MVSDYWEPAEAVKRTLGRLVCLAVLELSEMVSNMFSGMDSLFAEPAAF